MSCNYADTEIITRGKEKDEKGDARSTTGGGGMLMKNSPVSFSNFAVLDVKDNFCEESSEVKVVLSYSSQVTALRLLLKMLFKMDMRESVKLFLSACVGRVTPSLVC